MLKHIYLILTATFVFGFILGAILWLFNHTGDNAPASPDTVDTGLTISVRAYGGCDSFGCASYRILDNGSYTFLIPQRDKETTQFDGKLSNVENKKLHTLVDKTGFVAFEQSQFEGTCPIAFDGLAYRYIINYKGRQYDLDSCKQNLQGSELFSELSRYFGVFQNQMNAQ